MCFGGKRRGERGLTIDNLGKWNNQYNNDNNKYTVNLSKHGWYKRVIQSITLFSILDYVKGSIPYWEVQLLVSEVRKRKTSEDKQFL